MSEGFTVCAVLPVYRHCQMLESVIAGLQQIDVDIIVVDDGNSGECEQLIASLSAPKIHVRRHEQNRGKGAAVKTGFQHARALGFSHALQLDADGQHDLQDVPRFIQAARENPQALISGCPVFNDSVPASRFYARYLTHVWVWINTCSLSIRDSMCGFRVYPLLQSCDLFDTERVGDRMDFDIEFLVRWFWRGHALIQLDTCVDYPEQGYSNFRLFKDNLLISRMHARLFFGMLTRFPMLIARRWRTG